MARAASTSLAKRETGRRRRQEARRLHYPDKSAASPLSPVFGTIKGPLKSKENTASITKGSSGIYRGKKRAQQQLLLLRVCLRHEPSWAELKVIKVKVISCCGPYQLLAVGAAVIG